MDSVARLRHAIAACAHEKFNADGFGWLGEQDTEAARAEARAGDRELELVLRELSERWQLEDKHHGHYVVQPHYALWYETDVDRGEFWRRNPLRRKMLAALLDVDETGHIGFRFSAEEEGWTEHSRGELFAAGKTLEVLGLADVTSQSFGTISLRITSDGVRVMTNATEMARILPLDATDDMQSGAAIVPDAIQPLILDCEQLLRDRGWNEALSELEAGDVAFGEERWKDAAGEYYRAVESGLKYGLDEAGVSHSDSTALRKLAALAVEHALTPSNYQELFGFLNSIRSPKAHGGGPKPKDVPIGRNEALLMGNHARALLLYIGGRTS